MIRSNEEKAADAAIPSEILSAQSLCEVVPFFIYWQTAERRLALPCFIEKTPPAKQAGAQAHTPKFNTSCPQLLFSRCQTLSALPWPFFGSGASIQEACSHHFFLQEERQSLANRGAFAPKPVDLWTKSLSRSAADHWRICCAGKTRRRIGAYPAGPSFFHTSPRESLCFILLHCLAKRLFRYAAPNHRADVLIFRSGFL